MPLRAQTVKSYIQATHLSWLVDMAKTRYGQDISYNMYDGKMYAYFYGELFDSRGLFEIDLTDGSATKFREQLAEYCDKNKITTADLSRDMIFKFFETNNVQGILRNNKAINKSMLKVGETIKDEMGVDTRSFSVWYRDAFDILQHE
jgi:hypothetical protein